MLPKLVYGDDPPVPQRDTGLTVMSEDLDLVRSLYVAFEEGDYSSVEWVDSEIEFVIADGPAPGSLGLEE